MEEDELVARVAISDLIGRYAECADNKDAEAYASLFAPDAHFTVHHMPTITGRKAVYEFIAGLPDNVPDTWHQMTSQRVDYLGDGKATGTVYYVALSDIGLDHWGRYEDEYREVEGRWCFQKRISRIEGLAPGSLMAALLDTTEK